jgi:cold shock CspA family protein
MLHFLYGFMARDSGGKDVFVQSPRVTDRASALSTRDKLSLSMLSRAESGSKPQGCAWSRPGPTQKRA